VECVIVGAGAVAEQYAAGLDAVQLELTAVCDRRLDRAEALADAHGVTAYEDLETLLAAESAPLVINLTSHTSHATVTETCLAAGRHVFSEKPLAMAADRAAELAALADRKDLALGVAPMNHQGPAQNHAAALLGDGRLGRVQLAYAHAHVGRVTEWHENPESFLDVGPLYDGAVYPLNLLVSWFGPVERVRSADAIDAWPDREDETPARTPHLEATLAFERGPVVRLSSSLYVPHRSREFYSLELHGDDGSLYLTDTGAMAAEPETVSVGGSGREYVAAPSPFPPKPQSYVDGPARLAQCIRSGDHPTNDTRRAVHVVAICNAIETAAAEGRAVTVPAHGFATSPPAGPAIRPPASDEDAESHGGAGRTAAIRLPPVGFGCSRYRDGEYVDRIDAIATAIDAGYRLFDSAELYGNESRIGSLLASSGTPDREHFAITGKVWNTNHEHVFEACEGSLDELGIDSFDYYFLHWPHAWEYQGPLRALAEKPVDEREALTFPTDDGGTPATVDVPLTETWRRMERLHDNGLANTLGLSNVTVDQLTTVVESARILPAVVQVESHPYRPRTRLLETCHDLGIRMMAHSPLSAPGLLDEPVLADIAETHGVSPAQVVIAWHRARGVVPIPASNDPDHIVENLAAGRIRLDESELSRIDALEDPEFER
jgi:diketogulonate reductase-like aldo/keto reductase/predicted dehydrogenase